MDTVGIPPTDRKTFDSMRLPWKGHILFTHGDFFDAFCRCETDAERVEFLRQAVGVSESIPDNIQYMIGYCDRPAARRLWARLARARAALNPAPADRDAGREP